jgi:beta-lactamase class A
VELLSAEHLASPSARPALRIAIAAAALAALAAGASGAAAADRALLAARDGLYPVAERAARAASPADPSAVQAAYDAARDLRESVRAAAPVSAGCRPLLRALSAYAGARVLQQEGVDRPSPADVAAGASRARAARGAVAAAGAACRGGGGGAPAQPLPMSPAPGEAFFGPVVARAPAGATEAALLIDGAEAARAPVAGGRARFDARAAPGPHTVAVAFFRGPEPAGRATSRGAVLLPAGARAAVPGSRADPALAAALARALRGGPRFAAAWSQDLRTGAAAGVNADAAFPAASTVKLGVLAGALARLGAAPERSAHAHDLRAMAAWSSNLAANRLVRAFGLPAAADGLRRLGARASTYPGDYIVGTELQPALPAGGAGARPPRVSARVTTARDLARMLFAIHATAAGGAAARRETGLTTHQARLALGWLLSSQQRGDNRGLLAGGAAPGAPIAQKNGWIRSARHAAAIVYDGRPRIVVMLTYDPGGVTLPAGRRIGGRLARA